MKLLSLDTSTKITGFAIYQDDKLLHYSSINLSHVKDIETRFQEMIKKIFDLIETESPDTVVVEEMVVTRNAQTQRLLTMILGAVYGECLRQKIHYHSLRPTQWRAAVRDPEKKLPRKREELKSWSIARVYELFGVCCLDDNISDVILIGMAYIILNKEREN